MAGAEAAEPAVGPAATPLTGPVAYQTGLPEPRQGRPPPVPRARPDRHLRRSFLHEISGHLAKTHGRLVVEDLAVANLVRNKHLARAIADAAWAEFGRQLRYKSTWLGSELVICDRWFPSTKTCSRCGIVKHRMGLAERTFDCDQCDLIMDRDRNAAANLAAWADAASMAAAQAPDRQAGGRTTNAHGAEGGGRHPGDGATGRNEVGTEAQVA